MAAPRSNEPYSPQSGPLAGKVYRNYNEYQNRLAQHYGFRNYYEQKKAVKHPEFRNLISEIRREHKGEIPLEEKRKALQQWGSLAPEKRREYPTERPDFRSEAKYRYFLDRYELFASLIGKKIDIKEFERLYKKARRNNWQDRRAKGDYAKLLELVGLRRPTYWWQVGETPKFQDDEEDEDDDWYFHEEIDDE